MQSEVEETFLKIFLYFFTYFSDVEVIDCGTVYREPVHEPDPGGEHCPLQLALQVQAAPAAGEGGAGGPLQAPPPHLPPV